MHVHSFKEITEQLDHENIGFPTDEILHIFECRCGFTLIEKKRPVELNHRQKKTTIYTVIRKNDPNSALSTFQVFPNPTMKTHDSKV